MLILVATAPFTCRFAPLVLGDAAPSGARGRVAAFAGMLRKPQGAGGGVGRHPV